MGFPDLQSICLHSLYGRANKKVILNTIYLFKLKFWCLNYKLIFIVIYYQSHSDDLNALARFSTKYAYKPNDISYLVDEERLDDEKTINKSDSKDKETSPKGNSSDKFSFQKQLSLNSNKNNNNNNIPTSSQSISEEKKEEKVDKIGFKSFEIIKILGAGSFGKVYLAKKKSNGKVYAMKALKKRGLAAVPRRPPWKWSSVILCADSGWRSEISSGNCFLP